MLRKRKGGVKKLLAVVLALLLVLPLVWMPAPAEASVADGIYAFGNNREGQLGLGDRTGRNSPVRIAGLDNVKEVASGNGFSLVLLYNGDVYSFGSHVDGKLGLGELPGAVQGRPDTWIVNTPTKITGIGAVKTIAAGVYHALLVLENGDVYAFGQGTMGKLGLGDTEHRYRPTKIPGLSGAVAVAAGHTHSLVLLGNGDVYGFGSHNAGQLGLGRGDNAYNTPQKIPLPGRAKDIAAGGSHSLVALQNGDVYAFGYNRYGELGVNEPPRANKFESPMKVLVPGPAQAVATGNSFSLVLLENGDLYSFGQGDSGQLGHGNTEHTWPPAKVEALSGVSLIAAGYAHTLAVRENGDVYAFGRNTNGQLGQGDTTARSTPTRVDTLRGNNALAIGAGHSQSLVVVGMPPITVRIDGRLLVTDVPPIIVQGRTMVPLRAIFEALDIDVVYDSATRQITGTKGGTTIQLTVDSTRTLVNGVEGTLDVPATVMEGRTLVPVRFIAESTGQDVDWEPRTRTVIIETSVEHDDISPG